MPTPKKATKPTAAKTTAKPVVEPKMAKTPAVVPHHTHRISPVKAGLTMGVLGVVYAFIIHLYPIFLNRNWEFTPAKGNSMKFVMSDIYVGYNMGETGIGLVYMTLWAFADGFIFAFLFVWLYNLISSNRR